MTITSPEHVKFNTNYVPDSVIEQRTSASGLSCTGDLDYPVAKSLSALVPVKQQHSSNSKEKNGGTMSMPPNLDNTANKIYTKELILSNKQSYIKSLSNSVSSFDEDLLKCLVVQEAQKKVQLKAGKVNGDHENNITTCNSSGSPTTLSPTCANVQFSDVTIQEYSIQPGVNPGGNKGCPLTIGWNPISSVTLNLDIYEKVRDRNRRSSSQLNLVSAHREQILQGLGHSKQAIMTGTKAANQTRRNRYQTIARLKSSKSQEMLEALRKNVHNFVTCGEKKRRERKFLAPYLPSHCNNSDNDSTSNSLDSNENKCKESNFRGKDRLNSSRMIKSIKSKASHCSISRR